MMTTKIKKEPRVGSRSARPRKLAPAKHVDQLIVLADVETGAKVRALAGRARRSISEILREIVAAGYADVEERYPTAELTGPQKAARTRAQTRALRLIK